jgi:RNA recognition motif-containing protein
MAPSTSDPKSAKGYKDDPTNLIVNYLPVYFTEEHLRELFAQYGHIESLIVMYNKHDNRKKSKGYGFVKFGNAEDAQAAIDGVDGTRIANKTIKVSVARPGRARRSSNVFVSRLPVNWVDQDLASAFSEFGHIVECRVLTFGDGVSRRCGFVRYDSDEEAKAAMMNMKNFRPTPRDAPLQVNLSVNHSPDARFEREQIKTGNGFLRNREALDYAMPAPWMSGPDFFNPAMQHPRYAREFVDDYLYGRSMQDMPPPMYDPLYQNAGRGMHNEMYNDYQDSYWSHGGPSWGNDGCAGKRFEAEDYGSINRSDPTKSQEKKTPQEGGSRLFVQNLPPFYEETHLKSLFSSYGDITDVTIQRDRHGKSIQCAFVVFSSEADARGANEALDGVMLSTQTLKIHVM